MHSGVLREWAMPVNPRVWLNRQWLASLLLAPGLALAAPFAYIPNGLSSTVSVIDTASNTVVATTLVGFGPLGVAVNVTGTRVYVSNSVSNSLSVIDTATNAVVATTPVGVSPGGVAANPLGTRVYVANSDSNSVSVIDTATNAVVATVAVGKYPVGVAVSPTGNRIYVANADSNSLSVIDAAANAVVATTPVGVSPGGVAANPLGTRVYVASGDSNSVSIIDASTYSVVGSVAVGTTPAGVALNPAGTRAYVANADSNNVSVIDTAANTVVATVAVGKYPVGVAVNPTGNRIYVANFDSNNVSVVDAATNTVVATIVVGLSPAALGQFIGPDVVTPPATSPDLNQHGLTGSWYEPATNGQGFEIEVFPDLVAAGTGSTQVSWFTFDPVAGGADRQRWYALSGNMVSGQANASLTIYQNTGGNFNAPPITNGVPVGTATLSFDTCMSGQLSYHFNDGRAGNIPLTRITQNVTCSATSARPTNADFAFSGNWYDATTSGQGFSAEVNPINGSVFVPWYTYAPAGAGAGAAGQRWYTASGAFTASSRSIALDIYETTGGVFDAPSVPAPHSVKVGTGTLTFQSCSTGTLNFTFTAGSSSGLSGMIALSRIGPVPPGCKY
jgi:YVTN family beta-propeller protein